MPNNHRPYIICHMLSSIDGRINGDFFSLPETGIAGQVTSRIRENYHCDGVLNGTVAEGWINNAVAFWERQMRTSSQLGKTVQMTFDDGTVAYMTDVQDHATAREFMYNALPLFLSGKY